MGSGADKDWSEHVLEHIDVGTELDAHYAKLPIQPMHYSMANGLDPMQHTIIKYVTRFRDKGGKRDLLAARKTIDMLLEYEYGEEHN
jgi:hypothetical protein